MGKIIESQQHSARAPEARHITELATGDGPVEIVTDTVRDMDDLATEAFMHEPVKIRVHGTAAEGELPIISVLCNGVCQPIPRDTDVVVKRKYVEVLARAKTVTYKQASNPMDPADITMVPTVTNSYPFAVIEDTDKGKRWLRELLEAPV